MSSEKRTYRTFYTGAIKDIFSLFVKPISRVLAPGEEENSLDHGIHRLFDADRRPIPWAQATGTFYLRGKRWVNGQTPHITEEGFRAVRVNKGDKLVIRFDEFMPDRIDIEFDEEVYSLKWTEWEVIRSRVEFVG